MLVLSRKKGEQIVVNDEITIVVVEIRGDKVRIGVEAPKSVPVHRKEVYDAIQRNLAAAFEATTEAPATGGHGQEAITGSEALPPASPLVPPVGETTFEK